MQLPHPAHQPYQQQQNSSSSPVTPRPAAARTDPVSPASASSKQLSSSATSASSVPSPPPAARPALKTSASTPLSASASSPLALFSGLPPPLQPSASINAVLWQSELIQDVLQVTIDKQRAAQRGNSSRIFLAEAAKEALSSSERVLSLDQLDSVLIERLSLPLPGHSCSLAYLISCYRRVSDILAIMRHIHSTLPASFASSLPEPLFLTTASDVMLAVESCDQLLARIIAYCCMVLTDDDVRAANQQELLRLLFSDPLLSRTLPPYFLDYIHKLIEPEQLEDVFTPIIGMCAGMAPPVPTLLPTAHLRTSQTEAPSPPNPLQIPPTSLSHHPPPTIPTPRPAHRPPIPDGLTTRLLPITPHRARRPRLGQYTGRRASRPSRTTTVGCGRSTVCTMARW